MKKKSNLYKTICMSVAGATLLGMSLTPNQSFAANDCPRVTAFYQSNTARWWTPKIQDLPTDVLTHVIMTFIFVNSDGSLNTSGLDPVIDELVAKGNADDTKVMVSVGGATADFLHFASNPDAVDNFVVSLRNYIADHNLDGVDIDWEKFSTHGQPNEVEAELLVNLLRRLRAALPRGVEMTVDVQSGSWSGINFSEDLDDYADFIHGMLYDYTGAWPSSPIAHNATWGDVMDGLHSGAENLNDKYDINKTVIGIPAYGKRFRDGQNSSVTTKTYRDIVDDFVIDLGIDPNIGISPGLTIDGDEYYWETPNLAIQKTEYAMNNDYAGVMVWDLWNDTTDEEYSIISAIGSAAPKCHVAENNRPEVNIIAPSDPVENGGSAYLQSFIYDIDGPSPVTYRWKQISPKDVLATIDNPTSPNTNVTFPLVSEDTEFEFELLVSDGNKNNVDIESVHVDLFDIQEKNCWKINDWVDNDLGGPFSYRAIIEPTNCSATPLNHGWGPTIKDGNNNIHYLLLGFNDDHVQGNNFVGVIHFIRLDNYGVPVFATDLICATAGCGATNQIKTRLSVNNPIQGVVSYGDKVRIRHVNHGKCITTNSTNGDRARNYTCSQDHSGMTFEIKNAGNGYVRLQSDRNQCLYSGSNNGDKVSHWVCWNDPNMRYKLEPSMGGYRLRHVNHGQCTFGSSNNGGHVRSWVCWNDPNMVYKLDIIE